MRPNRVAELLAGNGLVVNAWVASGNPYVAEVLGHCGYDAVTIDLQHGMFGVDTAVSCLQAVSATPAVPLVRCRSNNAEDIGHLLDAGAYGVICPSIDDAAAAAAFVAACRYPPVGRRSFGPARGLLYGGADYLHRANDMVITVAMVESPTALEHLDEILGVKGLDAIYVGPNDLAVSAGWPMLGDGMPGRQLGKAIRAVAHAASRRDVAAGIFAPTAEQAAVFGSWGYRLITPGNDIAVLRSEASRRVDVVRRSAAPPSAAAP
jgi:4-hydroxy-2-oxoheptanedioate aldolase